MAALETRIVLSGLWICVALTYLLGDVLRIFTGDFTPGEIGGVKVTQAMSMGIAVLMVIPIVMVFLSLVLGYSVNRWANVIIAIFFFGFNFLGIPTYASLFDKFLLGVSLVFNALTIWLAWHWTGVKPINYSEWNTPHRTDNIKSVSQRATIDTFSPGEVFDTIHQLFTTYVDFRSDVESRMLTLWTIATYFYTMFPAFPYLTLNGPKNSGKSTVMRVLQPLAFNMITTSDPTDRLCSDSFIKQAARWILMKRNAITTLKTPECSKFANFSTAATNRGCLPSV